jgi:hypothetical protein
MPAASYKIIGQIQSLRLYGPARQDILDAEAADLVTIVQPGTVVLCPIISEMGAEAPGNDELSEEFLPFPDTF